MVIANSFKGWNGITDEISLQKRRFKAVTWDAFPLKAF
jgi:hypothetical protein